MNGIIHDTTTARNKAIMDGMNEQFFLFDDLCPLNGNKRYKSIEINSIRLYGVVVLVWRNTQNEMVYVLCNIATYFQCGTHKKFNEMQTKANLEVMENSIELFTVIFQVVLFGVKLLSLLFILSTYFWKFTCVLIGFYMRLCTGKMYFPISTFIDWIWWRVCGWLFTTFSRLRLSVKAVALILSKSSLFLGNWMWNRSTDLTGNING